MDATSISITALAIAVFAHMVAMFFKTPKESTTELASKLQALDLAHQTLALKVESVYSRHDEAIENLTDAFKRFTDRFEKYMDFRNGIARQ